MQFYNLFLCLGFMHLIYLLWFRYWLYATVKLGCLLVTNDEMRDHIFELLGSNFFNQWKERHQVRYLSFLRSLKSIDNLSFQIFVHMFFFSPYLQVHYTFVKGNLKLQMPPSYSLVIQVTSTMSLNYKSRNFLFWKLFLNEVLENIVFQESEKGSWHVPLALGSSDESSKPWLCITRATADDVVATVSNGVDTSGNGDRDEAQKLAGNVHSLDSPVIENKSTSSVTGKRKERSHPSW